MSKGAPQERTRQENMSNINPSSSANKYVDRRKIFIEVEVAKI